MADYGHELNFGTFITPHNQRSDEVVALAQLSERVGLDYPVAELAQPKSAVAAA